jgi:CcmD family protein
MDGILKFFEDNPFYVVLLITLIIWAGLFFYTMRMGKKIKNLEKLKNNI